MRLCRRLGNQTPTVLFPFHHQIRANSIPALVRVASEKRREENDQLENLLEQRPNRDIRLSPSIATPPPFLTPPSDNGLPRD
ncbi:hypothetical protein M0804_000255 [Polistes exclamans]|nr:hypothetical protein M0804_000255 [Polistes exclamans]